MSLTLPSTPTLTIHGPEQFADWNSAARRAASQTEVDSENASDRWLGVLKHALRHEPYLLEATAGERTVGRLPLCLVKSAIFGRYLVSLPYINSAGVVAESEDVARLLIDGAAQLADQLDVRYLELRHEREIAHPRLTEKNESKVQMRLALPTSAEELWSSFKSKLRSQIRSGEKHGFQVCWGRTELLRDFYSVFSRNMRDLGTPVYSARLFSEILAWFGEAAELCVLRQGARPVAAALLVHHDGITEVPSASSLREFNSLNPNMVMYWNLLTRTIERGQRVFDFGRSSVDSGTYRFKSQWGAQPSPSVWQYYLRQGSIKALRPDNSRFGLAIRIWRRLPVAATRIVGPWLVRGIP